VAQQTYGARGVSWFVAELEGFRAAFAVRRPGIKEKEGCEVIRKDSFGLWS